ncbi:hypothetical protein AAH450_01985 [Erwinia sp. P7711]|uniref:hypothetical protein n=1 Tax=Erwinia sp. P7711 TaxID=3141451 RepID=UPI00318CFA54
MNVLSKKELPVVSGSGANSNSEFNISRNNTSRNHGSAYSGVDSCGAGILGGLVAGMAGGPGGMALGVVGGMIAGQCTNDSFRKGNGGGGGSAPNYGGQCTCQVHPKKQENLMKAFFYYLVYFLLFIMGFRLLNNAHILDFDTPSRSESFSKFVIMIIVLLAVTRWGIKVYKYLTDYK